MTASIREFFGANFRRVLDELKARGIDNQKVAKVMGVAPSQLSTYKDGVIPDPDKLNKFCNRYKIPTEELFIDPTKLIAHRAGLKGIEPRLVEAAKQLLEALGYTVSKKPKR